MANNPKGKRNKALYIVLIILIIVLAGVLIYYFVFAEKGQNKEQDIETTEEVTDEIDTSDWETYMSEEYGFSFKYPEEFNNSEIYNLWETKEGVSLFLYQWGANRGQETIISISVFDIRKENEVIEKYDYHFSGQEVFLRNNKKAEKISMGNSDYNDSLFIKNGDYIYIINSLFALSDHSLDGYKIYNNILESIIIE